jgi:hypothetical protein
VLRPAQLSSLFPGSKSFVQNGLRLIVGSSMHSTTIVKWFYLAQNAAALKNKKYIPKI